MTRPQAAALSNQLAARRMAHSIGYSYDVAAATDRWEVRLTAGVVYTGPDLAALAAYCDANGLALTAIFDTLGVT